MSSYEIVWILGSTLKPQNVGFEVFRGAFLNV